MADVSAYGEARLFFALSSRPGESIERIRRDIRPSRDTATPMYLYRARVLHFFDAFVAAGRVMRIREFPKPPKLPKPPSLPRVAKFDNAAILEALRRGATNAEIATAFGCCPMNATRIAKRHGLSRRKGNQLSERTKSIIAAIQSGEPKRTIAERFQVKRCYVWHVQKSYVERVHA